VYGVRNHFLPGDLDRATQKPVEGLPWSSGAFSADEGDETVLEKGAERKLRWCLFIAASFSMSLGQMPSKSSFIAFRRLARDHPVLFLLEPRIVLRHAGQQP
jgi:hypothetical protein